MTSLIALRILHIVGGVFWVGATLFVAGFLLPSVRAIGPAGGPLMRELTQVRKFPVYMLIIPWLTAITGLLLAWRNSGGGFGWFAGPGRVFGVGAVLALLTAVMGMSINAPTAKRIGALAASIASAGRPLLPEEQVQMHALQARMTTATRTAALLLVLATIAMSIGRYVP
ncbi:MAG: hypothetical protein HOP28_16705 [Gemmatimonadales bacterium]|nr:hypothetical protein [Gemmatimonadales bacterium]